MTTDNPTALRLIRTSCWNVVLTACNLILSSTRFPAGHIFVNYNTNEAKNSKPGTFTIWAMKRHFREPRSSLSGLVARDGILSFDSTGQKTSGVGPMADI